MTDLLKFSIDWRIPKFTIETNWWFLVVIIFIVLIILLILRKNLLPKPDSIEMEIGGPIGLKVKVDRTKENIYISHRILIELETRKAAIEIDPNQDVIADIYSSWYKLFGIIRDEIKNVPAKYLNSSKTLELLRLARPF